MTAIPEYLYSLPSNISLPVQTKIQELPFRSLSWEDFERLTLRYVENKGELEFCHLYGQRGQKQEGIDLFVRHNSDDLYTVYQCKQYKNYTVTNIKSAISTFLKGKWVEKCKTFYICTSCDLSETKLSDEIEKQSKILKKHNINLLVLDELKLSSVLKDYPKIVYDFFGTEWTKQFCGLEKFDQIKSRLNAGEFKNYKDKLGKFYSTLFENHEGSISNLSGQNSTPKFEERYIPPDIVNNTTFDSLNQQNTTELSIKDNSENNLSVDLLGVLETDYDNNENFQLTTIQPTTNIENRLSAIDWVSSEKNTIVIGGPGSGKSALLKYIILGLLEQVAIRDKNLLQNRNKLIPVWLPFGYWSNYLEKNPSSSMLESMQSWFSGMDHNDLWPLIETAIQDDRLLLVIDGLDEWSSEQSALICLQKLTVFIEEREASSIISSRPSGLEQLGTSVQNWPKGYLVGLTKEQQKRLITTCTEYRLEQQNKTGDELLLKHEVNKITKDLTSEISRNKDLSDLASVPLLMYMLIHLKTKSISLPHSRFQVYKALVADLVKVQPQRRRTAAQVISINNGLSENEIISILARLAFDIQLEFPHGNAPIDIAQKFITNYLSDQSQEFAFTKREAIRHTEKFISIGESEVGILVKKSIEEIGFFHRTLQEFLAAQYISTLACPEQESLLSQYMFNGQWKDVFLGMFSLLQRPSDVEDLIKYIKALKFDNHKSMSRENFLAEIAFGENRCSANTARSIANSTFSEIENGKYLPHRKVLLNTVLSGYSSNKLHDDIVHQLNSWIPSTHDWLTSLFAQIDEHWACDEITVEILFSGLALDDFHNKRSAAMVIVNKFRSNQEILNRLVKLVKTSLDLNTRLIASEAIIKGWYDSREAKSIYNSISETTEPTAKLLKVYYETLSGKVSDDNKKLLLEFSNDRTLIDYNWKSIVGECIKLKYIDNDLKSLCLNRVYNNSGGIELDLAQEILISHFYNDNEFITYFIDDLKNDHPKFVISIRGSNARDIKKIIDHSKEAYDAMENWVIKDLYSSYFAYHLFKTSKMKSHLIRLLNDNKTHLFWPTGALLLNWGIEDALVKEAIFKVINNSTDKASSLAHYFPQIFLDKTVCFNKLNELIIAPSNGRKRYDFIIRGITEVANIEQCNDVAKILLKQSEEMASEIFDESLILLLKVSTEIPEIKELANKELKQRDGNLGLVAATFCKDDLVREEILKKIKTLPSQLRFIISSKLSEIHTEQSSWELLSNYDNEVQPSVKATLAIGYYSSPLANPDEESINKHTKRVIKELYSVGHDYNERRVTALCGVLAINQLDKIKGLKDSYDKDKCYSINLESSYKNNEVYFSYLAERWDYIKVTFGQDVYKFLGMEDNKVGQLFSCLGPYVENKTALKQEFRAYLYNSDLNLGDRVLMSASKIIPKEELLLRMCFFALGLYSKDQAKTRRSYNYHKTSLLALYILEQQFYNDDKAKSFLLEIYESNQEQKDILLTTAFSIGFNDAPFIDKIKKELKCTEGPMWLAAHFNFIGDTKGNKQKIELVLKHIEHLANAPQQYSKYFCRLMSKLINSSDSLYREIIKRIKIEKSEQKKLHLLFLLTNSKGLNKALKGIAIELDNKQRRKRYPDVIFDVEQGRYSTATLSLKNILYNE